MSGTANNRWTLRLSTEGADQVIRDLRAAATESAAAGRAYDALIKAQPQLATGAERAEQALRRNVDAMRATRGEVGLLGSALEGAASSMGRFGSALTSPAAAMASLGASATGGAVAIAKFGDEYTVTMNKLRAATGSLGAAQQVYGELVALSQQTGASISESASAFGRFAVASRSVGATNAEVLQLTRTIQQAGLMAGASTQETQAGVQQLGQALASGKLQGDELRSIMENLPTIAEALARELGVSIGQLRTMGSEGQLTSDRVFQALLRAGEQINKQFAELPRSMAMSFGILGQTMVDFVGKLDQALGLSQRIAEVAREAAGYINRLNPPGTPATPEARLSAAEDRRGRMQAELAALEGADIMGPVAPVRRGTISRGLQETAAQSTGRDERLATLRANIEAENQVIAAARAEQNQIHQTADDLRQAEEATAAARRAAAQRTAQTASFNATREALDKEGKARADHATRVAAIDAGLANGDTDAAGAARLRTLADNELAEALRERGAASGGAARATRGTSDADREAAEAARQAAAVAREGASVTASVRTEAEKYADELARLNGLLEAGAISQETFNRAATAADPAVRAAADAARRIEQDNARTTDRITTFFGDAFARAFEGTGNGFRSLMESFKRAAISTFASIAAQAIIRPIVAPIVSSLGLGSIVGGSGGFNLGGVMGGPGGVSAAGSTTDAMNLAGQSLAMRQAGSYGNLGSAFTNTGFANTGFGALDGALNSYLISPTTLPSATNDALTAMGGALGPASPMQVTDAALGAMGGAYGPAAPGALAGASVNPGLTVAGGLGAGASIIGGAYGMYTGLQRGGVGGYTSALGGAVSAATGIGILGSAAGLLPALGMLGPIGLGLGAVLAIAGALMPGQTPSGRGQEARLNLDTGAERFNGLGGDRFSQGNRDAAQSAVGGIADLARQIGDSLGGARIGGEIAVGVTSSRGGGPGTLYLDVDGRKAQFANDEEGSRKLAEEAARFVIEEFKQQGTASGDYASILSNTASDPQQLAQNIQWYEETYKGLTNAADAVKAYAQQVQATLAPIDAAIEKARSLGLAEGELAAQREETLQELVDRRNEGWATIRDMLDTRALDATGQDSFDSREALRVRAEARAAEQELEQLRQEMEALGSTAEATTAVVEELRQTQAAEAAVRAENARKQRDAASQQAAGSALGVITSLRDYALSLSTTEAGAGTALDRLAASQREFDAVFGAAQAGDARSISGLQGAAEGFRANARAVFGGGQGYADALRLVEQRITAISGLGADALTASFVAENARENTDRIVDALADLRRENAALRADLNMLLMRPAA